MKKFLKKLIVPIITWQAMHCLGRFQPKIIAITGSVGKTSTKEAIHAFLKRDFEVRKSEKSFNSEIGVPLTILGLQNAWLNPVKWIWNIIKGFYVSFISRDYPEILILEIGADHPGDIKQIVSWLRPDIAVVTALAEVPVHVENFPNPTAVYDEKAELIKALPREGAAILNKDDRLVWAMKDLTEAEVLGFGIENMNEISISGLHNPYPVLAGAAVAKKMGVPADDIREISANIETPPGRMMKLPGINNSMIIDDTYNSSPIALEAALDTLKNLEIKGRKIAVLGDMAELGEYSEEAHRKIGRLILNIVDELVVVGPRAQWIFEEAKSLRTGDNRLLNFKVSPDATEAGLYLKNIIKEGDVILVKGSQSIRMERCVEKIISDPEKNNHLLVRQEKEWKRKI